MLLQLLCGSRERNSNGVAENIANRSPLSLEGTWLFYAVFYAIWPIFYGKRKAGHDKMSILTLMLYCTSKSCKILVASGRQTGD